MNEVEETHTPIKGVCFIGETPNPIFNARGNVVRMPITCYEKKVMTHKELINRVRLMSRLEDNGHFAHCFVCNVRVRCSKAGDLSNVLHHFRSSHIELIPPPNWTEEEKSKYEEIWQKHAEEAKKAPLKQLNILQYSKAIPPPVSQQKRELAKAVAIGNLPIALDTNLGTRSLIELYNSGTFPRGLGRNAIAREIALLGDEYTEVHIHIYACAYSYLCIYMHAHLFMFVCMCPAYIYTYLLMPFRHLVIYLRCVYVVDYKISKLDQQVILIFLHLSHIQDVKSSTRKGSSLFCTDYDEEVI